MAFASKRRRDEIYDRDEVLHLVQLGNQVEDSDIEGMSSGEESDLDHQLCDLDQELSVVNTGAEVPLVLPAAVTLAPAPAPPVVAPASLVAEVSGILLGSRPPSTFYGSAAPRARPAPAVLAAGQTANHGAPVVHLLVVVDKVSLVVVRQARLPTTAMMTMMSPILCHRLPLCALLVVTLVVLCRGTP